jgi:hypothetical protein
MYSRRYDGAREWGAPQPKPVLGQSDSEGARAMR